MNWWMKDTSVLVGRMTKSLCNLGHFLGGDIWADVKEGRKEGGESFRKEDAYTKSLGLGRGLMYHLIGPYLYSILCSQKSLEKGLLEDELSMFMCWGDRPLESSRAFQCPQDPIFLLAIG